MLQIAQVLKSNGTDGEILLGFRGFGPEDIDVEEPVFIYFDGLPVPFFFRSFTRRGLSKALARLTGVNCLKDAEELAGRAVYIDCEEEDEEEDFTGWTVMDEHGHRAGVISGMEYIPGNTCIYVDTESGQAMLPLHEELILSADEESMTLCMSIPEGLL